MVLDRLGAIEDLSVNAMNMNIDFLLYLSFKNILLLEQWIVLSVFFRLLYKLSQQVLSRMGTVPSNIEKSR